MIGHADMVSTLETTIKLPNSGKLLTFSLSGLLSATVDTSLPLIIRPSDPQFEGFHVTLKASFIAAPGSAVDSFNWKEFYQAPCQKDGIYHVPINGIGLYSFHLVIRHPDHKKALVDQWIGQSRAIALADFVTLLFDRPMAQKVYTAPRLPLPPREQLADAGNITEFCHALQSSWLLHSTQWQRAYSAWHDEERFAAYVCTIIHHAWSPTQSTSQTETSCSLHNPEIAAGTLMAPRNFREFLNSPYACCTDYVFLLAAVLKNCGIESKIINNQCHYYLEAKFSNRCITFDPTYAFLFRSNYASLLKQNELFLLSANTGSQGRDYSAFYNMRHYVMNMHYYINAAHSARTLEEAVADNPLAEPLLKFLLV